MVKFFALVEDHIGKTRADRFEMADRRKVWADHKCEWMENPVSEIDFCGFHFILSYDATKQRLWVSCDKFKWVEDYAPVYITGVFSGGSRELR